MSVNDFLAADPLRNHPDFQGADVAVNNPHQHPACLMPNLIELIRRMGGPDWIPDARESDFPVHDEPDWDIRWRDGDHWDATLRRKDWKEDPGEVLLKLSRYRAKDGSLYINVENWHPHNDLLEIDFTVPTDWTAAPWTVATVMDSDMFSTSAELDTLAAKACDTWVGLVNDPSKTYCHIRRDSFVF
jgi:hypothetical protein